MRGVSPMNPPVELVMLGYLIGASISAHAALAALIVWTGEGAAD